MKKIFLFMLLCLPFSIMAQTNPKYLEGAVTLNEDNRVSFKTAINAPSLSAQQIYDTLLKWADNRFQPEGKCHARVLYTNENDKCIAAGGEEYIVFASSALALDRSRIYYQLLMNCNDGKCDVEMTRIRYWYDEERDGGQKYNAEEWITDDIALNKSKTKLAPVCGKFRRKTIDLKDELFKAIQDTLASQLLNNDQTVIAATPVPATVAEAPEAKAQDDEALIRSAARMTITAGNDEQFEIGKDCWGGFGELFGKKVAFCLIDTQKTIGNLLLGQSDTYTVSFYQAGNSTPSVVVKCKKLMTQTVTGEEAQKMNAASDAQKSYNMYVGEIMK